MRLERFDGLQGAPTRGERVFNNDHASPFGEPTLNASARAMSLGLFAHRESMDGVTLHPAPVGNGARGGISAHGEPSDPFWGITRFRDRPEGFDPHQKLALGRKEGLSGVNVVRRMGAACEDERSTLKRAFHEQVTETETVVHLEKNAQRGRAVNRGPSEATRLAPRRRGAFGVSIALGLVVLGGCDGGSSPGADPGPFGEVGEIRVDVQTPTPGGVGRVESTLLWLSDGRWALAERMFHEGVMGDEVVRRSRGNPGDLQAEYQALILQLNENPALRLFGAVNPDVNLTCIAPQSRIDVALLDTRKNALARWTRCVSGGLWNLSAPTAGPDLAAVRVVTAAQLVRGFTVGDQGRSAFEGSLSFATLARGDDSPARPSEPRVFLSKSVLPPSDFVAFWASHAGASAPLPNIDWEREMVLLAAAGVRDEAGRELRIRRVLPVGTATLVEVVEDIPGDFCSPAKAVRHPFHLVRTPLGPVPITFGEILPNRFPCGL